MNPRSGCLGGALVLLGCVTPPTLGPPQDAASTTATPDADAEQTEARSLGELDIPFEAPPPRDPVTFPKPPSSYPEHDGSSGRVASIWPDGRHGWPDADTDCYPAPIIDRMCGYHEYDAAGAARLSVRLDYTGDEVTRATFLGYPEHIMRIDSCVYDSSDKVLRRVFQSRHGHDACGGWGLGLFTHAYDEHGALTLSAEGRWSVSGSGYEGAPEAGALVHLPTYDNDGRIIEHWQYETDAVEDLISAEALDTLQLSEFELFTWQEDELVRMDRFGPDGHWRLTRVFTRLGDLLRLDEVRHDAKNTASLETPEWIYQRLTAGELRPVFRGPDQRWEYEQAEGVEVERKFSGDVLVERRRFEVVQGQRRLLTVEKLVPEVVGLRVVESWDWSRADRVIVERQDGRVVYLLDCSGEPSLESLVDPGCPPPRPLDWIHGSWPDEAGTEAR